MHLYKSRHTWHDQYSISVGEMGETILRYPDAKCQAPGCDGWYRDPVSGKKTPGAERGFCHKHYRTFQRCGDPLGVQHVTRVALQEAAHTYGDALYAGQGVAGATGVLVEAAWAFFHANRGGANAARNGAGSAEYLAALCTASALYTNWPDGDDAGFERASKNLDAAAIAYARTLAVAFANGR